MLLVHEIVTKKEGEITTNIQPECPDTQERGVVRTPPVTTKSTPPTPPIQSRSLPPSTPLTPPNPPIQSRSLPPSRPTRTTMTLISVSNNISSPSIDKIKDLYIPTDSPFEDKFMVDIMELTDKIEPSNPPKNPWMLATSLNITNRMYSLAAESNNRPNEQFLHLIHYSGYSKQEDAGSDMSESDNLNEQIIVSGPDRISTIRDDTLRLALQSFGENSTILFVFDCGYAMTMLDLRYTYFVKENKSGALYQDTKNVRMFAPPSPLRCKVFSLFGTTINDEPGELVNTLRKIRSQTDITKLGIKELLAQYKKITNHINDEEKKPQQGVSFDGMIFNDLYGDKERTPKIGNVRLFDFPSLTNTVF